MDFQTMYDNMQEQIKAKVAEIEAKRKEISNLEAEIFKIQGATEMLVIVSKQLEEKEQTEQIEQPKDEEEVKDAKEQEGYVPVK